MHHDFPKCRYYYTGDVNEPSAVQHDEAKLDFNSLQIVNGLVAFAEPTSKFGSKENSVTKI